MPHRSRAVIDGIRDTAPNTARESIGCHGYPIYEVFPQPALLLVDRIPLKKTAYAINL